MGKKRAAIVCNGKEIAHGINLLHLHKYVGENETFVNENTKLDIEIYSPAAFRCAGLPKGTVKIFIGNVRELGESLEMQYHRWGITIWGSTAEWIVKADPKNLSEAEYIQFLEYANQKRKEYMEAEEEYIRKVMKKDQGWIAGEFKMAPDRGLLGRVGLIKSKLQQQYDCAAFVLYLDILQRRF